MFEDFDLDSRLMTELLLISDDFECDFLLSLVVEALMNFPEGALSEQGEDFVAIGDVVMWDHQVVASLIIEARIELGFLKIFNFVDSCPPCEPNFLKLQNFALFCA